MGYVLPLQKQHLTYYIIIIMDMLRLQDKTTYTTCMTQEHLHLAWVWG